MRQLRVRLLFLFIAVIVSSVDLTARAQRFPESIQAVQVMTYIPSDEVFPNPERGFYAQDMPLWINKQRSPQSVEDLRALRDEGISLVRWYFLIDEFRSKALSASVLSYIDSQFDVAREAGVKVIPRFAYNFPMGGEYPFTDPDAPLSRVLSHIDQLKPVLRGNADVIAFMELGFVGAWGEWHSSTHKLVNDNKGINSASRQIVARILNTLPKNRMVAMRYTPYKQQLYGDKPIYKSQAFNRTMKTRMGAHNDCFLASATDFGTYPEDPPERHALRLYLNKDNRFVPQGGETCNADAEAQPYISCGNALTDVGFIRFSALNRDYHPDVLQGWKDGGCYDEIARRLGYRFRLIEAEMPTEVTIGDELPINITLINDGVTSPYNRRKLQIILRSLADGETYPLRMTFAPDPRRWLPDDGELDITIKGAVRPTMPVGEYEVLLNLPDPTNKLKMRPEYSIRLANTDVWEPDTGYNNLLMTVFVTQP